jgi:hypothetical protein
LVLNVQVPKVYPQIITADKGLSITVHGNTVNMVSMGIGIGAPGYRSNNSIMMCKAWQLKIQGTREVDVGHRSRCPTSTGSAAGCQVMGEIVLSHDF